MLLSDQAAYPGGKGNPYSLLAIRYSLSSR